MENRIKGSPHIKALEGSMFILSVIVSAASAIICMQITQR